MWIPKFHLSANRLRCSHKSLSVLRDVYSPHIKKKSVTKYHGHHSSPRQRHHSDTDDRLIVNYLEKRLFFYKRLEIKSCGLHRGFARGMQKISRA